MTFTDREFWIYFMTVMHTSGIAKQIPMKTQQAIDMYVRKKICPNITMKEWLEIEKDIIKYKYEIQEAMALGVMGSMGEKQTKEDQVLFAEMENLINDDKESLLKIIDKHSKNGRELNIKNCRDAYEMILRAKKDLENKNFE